MLSLGVCFPEPCSSDVRRFTAWRWRLNYYQTIGPVLQRTNSMKCFVNWIPVNIHVRLNLNKTQACLETYAQAPRTLAPGRMGWLLFTATLDFGVPPASFCVSSPLILSQRVKVTMNVSMHTRLNNPLVEVCIHPCVELCVELWLLSRSPFLSLFLYPPVSFALSEVSMQCIALSLHKQEQRTARRVLEALPEPGAVRQGGPRYFVPEALKRCFRSCPSFFVTRQIPCAEARGKTM